MKVAYGIVGAVALCAGFAGGLAAAPHLFPRVAEPGKGWVDLSMLPEGLIAWHKSPEYLTSETKTYEMIQEREAIRAARPKRVLPEGVPDFPAGSLFMPPEGVHWPEITPLGDPDAALAAAKDKWVVLNLWATWCAPCVKELPDMDAAAPLYAERGVTLLALNADLMGKDTLEAVEAMFAKRGVSGLLPLTASPADVGEVISAFGYSLTNAVYPTNIIFKPGGEPYAVFSDVPSDVPGIWASDDMTAFLDALVKSGG